MMSTKQAFIYLLALLAIVPLAEAQTAETVELSDNGSRLSLYLTGDTTLPDCDRMAFDVHEDEIYIFYSQGNKLVLRYSLNEGIDWKEEFIAFYQHNKTSDLPLGVVRTSNGYMHLFYIEQDQTQKRLIHVIRTNPNIEWFTQVIHQENSQNRDVALAIEEDCNFNLFIAFHLGEGKIHQGEYKSLKWILNDFAYDTKNLDIDITAGFDRDLHIALAEDKGDLKLATRYLQEDNWNIKSIGKSGQAPSSIAKTLDGGLLITNSALVSGRNKPLRLNKFNAKKGWATYGLRSNDSADFKQGNYKSASLSNDQSGRLHMALYLTDYSASSRKSLCYLYSNDNGKSWFSHTLKTDIYGYAGQGRPQLDFNDKYVFVAFKSANRYPAIQRFKGVNLKGIPVCMPRKSEVHKTKVVKRIERPKMVQAVERPKKSNKSIGNPALRKTETQAEFITNDAALTLILKDYREVDGDTVSVFLNGQCVLHRYGLQSKAHTLKLTIEPNQSNELLLYAESEGSRPPCTVALSLRNKTRKQDYIIQSSMQSNGAINLRPSR